MQTEHLPTLDEIISKSITEGRIPYEQLPHAIQIPESIHQMANKLQNQTNEDRRHRERLGSYLWDPKNHQLTPEAIITIGTPRQVKSPSINRIPPDTSIVAEFHTQFEDEYPSITDITRVLQSHPKITIHVEGIIGSQLRHLLIPSAQTPILQIDENLSVDENLSPIESKQQEFETDFQRKFSKDHPEEIAKVEVPRWWFQPQYTPPKELIVNVQKTLLPIWCENIQTGLYVSDNNSRIYNRIIT